MAEINSSLIPNGLVNLLPNPRMPWYISPSLFERLQKAGASEGAGAATNFKGCQVTSSDPEFAFIMKYFNHSKPKNLGIRKITCIHNALSSQTFEVSLLQTEATAKGFPPSWQGEEPKAERTAANDRWRRQVDQFSPIQVKTAQRIEKLTATKILPLWHGTTKADAICSNGFAFFGKHALFKSANSAGPNTDIGFFGSGIYFTNSAQYAAMYSANKVGGTILLAWVAMREPFPVVSDVAVPKEGSDMTMLKGKGAYKNYNAHYIPVTSTDPSDSENMIFHPCSRIEKPAWDEYVVFHTSQTLARFQVELGVDFPSTLSVSGPVNTVENLLDKILEMLDVPLIKEDKDFAQHLNKKSEKITSLTLTSPLSAQDQEIYDYIAKLLDVTGKPRNAVRQRLIELLDVTRNQKLEHKQSGASAMTDIPMAPMPPVPKPASPAAGPVPYSSVYSNGAGAGAMPSPPKLPLRPPPSLLMTAANPVVQSVYSGPGAGYVAESSRVTPIVSIASAAAAVVPEMAFGKAQWEKYFGDIGEEPPLPADIHEILKSRCPIWPEKTIEQTHVLVLIPQTVKISSLGGLFKKKQQFTLNSLGEMIKYPKAGYKTCYKNYFEALEYECGRIPVERSYWVLMAKHVIPESWGKSYEDQIKLVSSLSQKAKAEYQVLNLIELVTSITMVYVCSEVRLIERSANYCVEKVNGCHCYIHNFGLDGLRFDLATDKYESVGVMPGRKFRY